MSAPDTETLRRRHRRRHRALVRDVSRPSRSQRRLRRHVLPHAVGDAGRLRRPHRAGVRAAGVGHVSSRCSGCSRRWDGCSRPTTSARSAGIPLPCSVMPTGRAASPATPTIVGKTIVVNRQPLEVVGVAPAGFAGLDFADPVDVYVPISMQPQMGPAWLKLEGRRFRFVQVFGRLRDGVSIEQAGAAMQPLYRAAARGRSAGRRVRVGVRRNAAGVPRRPADRRRCVARALEPADIGAASRCSS